MFGGGSSAPAEQQQSDNALASQANNDGYQSSQWGPRSCENDAKTFTKCLDENQGNMRICGWYLEQLAGPSLVRSIYVSANVRDRMLASLQLASTRGSEHSD